MRITIIGLLFCIKVFVFGQDNSSELPFSKIYFVHAYTTSGALVYIQFVNQTKFTLPSGSVVEYKIFSAGEISIELIDYYGRTKYCNLNIKRGNEYYVHVTPSKFGEVKKEDVQKIIDDPKNYIKREENIDFPINKSSFNNVRKSGGQGTCFLISPDGYFITNYHCIANSTEITIRGVDNDYSSKYSASVIAVDPSNDLALLRINNKNIKFDAPTFAFRLSGIEQGEKVYALGYPQTDVMGQEVKVTDGIISAKSGALGDVSKFQISAVVNPGNSGGPLIDEKGNIIGVIYAKSTVAEAAGYAIKSDYVMTFLRNIDGFTMPVLANTIADKTTPEKVAAFKKCIFIVEAK